MRTKFPFLISFVIFECTRTLARFSSGSNVATERMLSLVGPVCCDDGGKQICVGGGKPFGKSVFCKNRANAFALFHHNPRVNLIVLLPSNAGLM